MRRLIGLTGPYKLAVFITIITLIAATTAELLTPILIQRTLDNYLLRREYALNLAAVEAGKPNRELADKLLRQGKVIGPRLFVPINSLKNLNGKQKEAAQQEGWLDREDWYVFQATSAEAGRIAAQYADLILSSSEWHAIKVSDRNGLSREERKQIRQNDYKGLTRGTLQYLGLLAVILIFTFGQVYAASWIAQRVMADMRGFLFNHIIRQSLSYLSKTPVGSLVSRVTSDVGTIAEFFDNVSTSFLKDFALMAGVVVVMFMLDVKLTLVSMAALIPTIILILIFRKKMREAFRRVRSRVSAVNSFLSERISGMSTVQLFDTEKQSARDFNIKGEELLNAELSQIRYMAVFRPLIELITSAAIALVLWYSTDLHQAGLVTLGVLIAFVELIQKFFQPVRDIAEKFNILQSAMAGGERVFAMLDSAERIPDTGTDIITCADPDELPPEKTSQCGEITFENVHFSYIPGEPVLQGLSFTLPPGTTTAIVGATGSGKTTIANLLTRLWDPQQGSIFLDGQDIRGRSLADLRETIQPVQQDVFLFAGTIAENIDLGTGLDEQRIEQAAELAKADTFIRRLPKGYQTEITEGAVNLSAGQRQLIAFARIIARDPRVIILDEATANIDTETESLLQAGLDSLLKNRTALIIAHRLSTIRRANRILVLGHGTLLEDGTHGELLAQGGVYHDLYELQFS
ncbi:MAG: hypothetical protein B0D92_04440 [Spirochaeta sp. LUC14_002_19_P3]|nr:MAG: hypothetical protein B0D92_04440 [Spirochaeta sp. LUC14_002_19_P3]